jgi:histidyl-tRNA synthetase
VAYVVSVGESTRGEAFALAHEMRHRGIPVDLDYVGRSAKGQMKQAGRTGARYAVIIGETEMATGVVTLRDLATGEESRIPRSEAVALAEVASSVRGEPGGPNT